MQSKQRAPLSPPHEHGVEQAAFEAYIGGKLARELKAADMNIFQAVIN